jgi:hypothetical protein
MGGWSRPPALLPQQMEEVRAAIFWVVEHVVPPIQILCRGFLPAEVKGGTCSRCYRNLPCSTGDILIHLSMVVLPHLRQNVPELNFAQRVHLQPRDKSLDHC